LGEAQEREGSGRPNSSSITISSRHERELRKQEKKRPATCREKHKGRTIKNKKKHRFQMDWKGSSTSRAVERGVTLRPRFKGGGGGGGRAK